MKNEYKLPETLEEYEKEEAERAELRRRMENLENDPEGAQEAAMIILDRYGHSRGFGCNETENLVKEINEK